MFGVLCAPQAFSQLTKEGNTFKIEKQVEKITPLFYQDKDGIYPIYISARGSLYIKKISKKTGKEYKYYLPKEQQEQIKKELKV